jgi:hypothetical protein
MQCSWTRIHLASCDTRVPYLHEQRGRLVSKGQRLRCRRVDQIQYVPLSRHCHCMGEQRKERYMYVCMYVCGRGRGRSGRGARWLVVVLVVGFRQPKVPRKLHRQAPSALEEFLTSSIVTNDHPTVGPVATRSMASCLFRVSLRTFRVESQNPAFPFR